MAKRNSVHRSLYYIAAFVVGERTFVTSFLALSRSVWRVLSSVSSRLISVMSEVVSRPDSALNLPFPFSAFASCSSASLMWSAASCLIKAA